MLRLLKQKPIIPQIQSQARGFATGHSSSLFRLPTDFVEMYTPEYRKPKFGFNGLGEIAYLRSYSRYIEELDRQEMWHETVQRVVNGCFSMQKSHFEKEHLMWNQELKTTQAMRMYDKIFNMKFLPPGRGLWAMGTPITEQKKLYSALNNCAFVSTDTSNIDEFISTFKFMMDSSMLGIGTGFDTKARNHSFRVYLPKNEVKIFKIPDTREGWVESMGLLLESYFKSGQPTYEFDYSSIRKEGVPLKTFGGVSGGPKPLMELH